MEHLNNRTEYVKSKYDSISPYYDLYELPMEFLLFRRWRRVAISKLKGPAILEVGVGTGKNLPFYSNEFDVLATDVSRRMLAKSRERLRSLKQPQAKIQLREMDVQNLDLPDRSFNSTLATFVFCSVPEPVKGLRELRRVLKETGHAVLFEHMRPRGILGKIFDLLNPAVVRITGVNINRETVSNVHQAGFRIIEERTLLLGVFVLIVATP